MSQHVSPWVYLVWNSGLLILGWLFHLPCYWSFQPKSFKIVFQTLSLFLLLGHHNLNVGALMLSHRSLSLFSFLSILFSLFCSSAVISIILSSNLHICSYASVILLIPSSVFQLLCCSSLVFVVDELNNSSSRSLLNISCISLIFVSILFLRFWIIFTVSTLNSFSGSLPISP